MSTQTVNGTHAAPPAAATVQASLATLRPPAAEQIQNMPAVDACFTTLQGFELLQRSAKLISTSTIIPKEYQGNIPNCAVALEMSLRIGCGYLQVMQNLDVVHGRPAWRAKFLISTVNTCGRFTAIRYEFFGNPADDSYGCRAWAIEKATGEKLVGPDITIKLAKDEGWYGKAGSKWKSIPQKMLMYRSGAWWSDLYAPELAMGLKTAEEEQDGYIDAERLEDGSYGVSINTLRNESSGNTAPVETTPAKTPKKTSKAAAEASPEPTTAAAQAADPTPNGSAAAPNDSAEPLQPVQIPARGRKDDPVQPDYDAWVDDFKRLAEGMHDAQSLEKLKKMNATVLGGMESRAPEKFKECMEAFTLHMVAVGGAA